MKLSYFRSVPSSSLRRTSMEFHTCKYDGGFPLRRASRTKAQFQSLLTVRRCVVEEKGSYITFLFPFPTAAVAFQASQAFFFIK